MVSIAGRRDDLGAKMVTAGVGVLMRLAERVAGDVTYPAAGLAEAINRLDPEAFREFCGEGGTERITEFMVDEAERYYEERMDYR